MTKDNLKEIIFFIGITSQLSGFVLKFNNLNDNPYQSILLVGIGFLFVLFYSVTILTKKEMKSNNVGFYKTNNDKLEYKFSKSNRIIAIFALLVSFSLFGFTLKKVSTPIHSIADSPIEGYKEYLSKINRFSLVKTYKVHWIGGGAFAELSDGRGIPYARKIKGNYLSMGTMYGTACALQFDIETRKDIPWVSIDEVRVRVIEYEKSPKYNLILPVPYYEATVHYIEIDDPRVAKTNVFQTKFIIAKGKILKNVKVRLERGKPETLAIRVNALKSGIYKIRCELLVRYKDQEEVIILNKDTEWLFD